jgi:hypothetical protein
MKYYEVFAVHATNSDLIVLGQYTVQLAWFIVLFPG